MHPFGQGIGSKLLKFVQKNINHMRLKMASEEYFV